MAFRPKSPTSSIAILHRAKPSLLRHDGHPPGDVVLQIPRFLKLQGRGVVDFDFKPGAVNVEFLAVAGHPEAEAGPARHLRPLRDPIACQIESPKLTTLVADAAGAHHR